MASARRPSASRPAQAGRQAGRGWLLKYLICFRTLRLFYFQGLSITTLYFGGYGRSTKNDGYQPLTARAPFGRGQFLPWENRLFRNKID